MKYCYTKGYKYQTAGWDYKFKIDLRKYLMPNWREQLDKIPFLDYDMDTLEVIVMIGFAHDGPSGPTKDDKTNMRACGAEHDPLYKLMRWGVVSQAFRPIADAQMKKTAKEDKMWRIRIWYYLKTMVLAAFAARPRNKKKRYVVGR